MYLNSDTFEQLYPTWDTLQHMIKARWKVAWQLEGRRHFQFSQNKIQQHKHEASSYLRNDFQSYPYRETVVGGEKKDADNIRN